MHAWANYIIDVGSRVGAHWGFSSANGQLGGFAIENLVDRGNDEYTAGRFGTFANGGNSVPYSPIELYLAGWVGPAEVPDLWLGKNAHWVIEGGKFKQNEKGEFVFRAPEVEIWSIERIIAQHGARRPDHRSAQRSFRGAYVLLVDATSPGEPEQLDMLGRQLEAFTRAGDDGLPNRYNFWEGTGGRASLRLDGLGELKGAATAVEPRIAVPARPNAGENLGGGGSRAPPLERVRRWRGGTGRGGHVDDEETLKALPPTPNRHPPQSSRLPHPLRDGLEHHKQTGATPISCCALARTPRG